MGGGGQGVSLQVSPAIMHFFTFVNTEHCYVYIIALLLLTVSVFISLKCGLHFTLLLSYIYICMAVDLSKCILNNSCLIYFTQHPNQTHINSRYNNSVKCDSKHFIVPLISAVLSQTLPQWPLPLPLSLILIKLLSCAKGDCQIKAV